MTAKGPDEELIKLIDVANVACGFHAGDPSIMRRMVKMCKEHGVKCGAHPGLQDLLGFGRRRMEIDPEDMYSMILYQVGALSAFLKAEGVPLNHIKPHGELFFYMQRDVAICEAVIKACAVFGVPVYGAKHSDEEKELCQKYGLTFVEEAYVDISWDKNKKLVRVGQGKLATPDDIYNRTKSIGMDDTVIGIEGEPIKLDFDGKPFSICIHSDMPTALENATRCRKAVEEINAARGWS
jgi:lactam utilization protein B